MPNYSECLDYSRLKMAATWNCGVKFQLLVRCGGGFKF
jgi:hypothetical protein